MKYIALEGDFVRLEPLALSHLPDLEAGFEPKLFDFYPKPYATAREFVEENLETQKGGTFLPFAIIHKRTGQAIGCTEFSSIDERNRNLEIGGSWIKPSHQGSAANSEAKMLLLSHVFEHFEYVRVQFTADARNAQSRAGIEGIGGKFEGILRNAMILPDGKLRDDAYYSIISQEWSETKIRLRQRIQKKIATERLSAEGMRRYAGSCLCKEVVFEVIGEFEKFFFCHCSRCRKETGSAHGANLFSTTAELKWISGEGSVKTYHLPNTRFRKSFCKNCGSAMPTIRENRSIVVPAGSLDCDGDFAPTGHIHMASRANWDQNLEQVARFEIYP